MYYHFLDESGNELPSTFEVFEVNKTNVLDFAIGQFGKTYYGSVATDLTPTEVMGFYWWSCSPGCLPDSDATGSFTTEAEAIADAQSI
jgi:hypothetical protein